MIRRTYLSAHQPLRKTFTPDGVTPYPLVKRFTTVTAEVPQSLKGMAQAVVMNRRHAVHGNALLKGVTLRELQNESRSGAVDALAAHNVLVLDVDGFRLDHPLHSPVLDRRATRALALEVKGSLPPVLQTASCLCSASSSMGTKPDRVSLHFEFWLDSPQTPQWQRNAIRHLNLTLPLFRSQLELSASGTTFRWKIDPALASNAQIRYIAEPAFMGGRENPVPDIRARHFLLRGSRLLVDTAALAAPAQIDAQVHRAVNEVRTALGMLPKRETMAYIGPSDNRTAVVTNPDRIAMTYVRDTEKFVYYNVNGGDSNAYYVRKFEPHVVYNFKGEPPFIFEAADPERYRWHLEQWVLGDAPGKTDAPPLPLVFRDPTVDSYFAGLIEVGTGRIVEMNPIGNLKAMKDFMSLREAPMPDPIPEFYYRFEPDAAYTFDPVGRRINKYRAPDHYPPQVESFNWTQASDWMKAHCPSIRLLVLHVVGGDMTSFHRFVNWIAAIHQTKQKLTTAWVLQGCQGTGKGLLFSRVLSPLFGEQYCKSTTIESLEEQFNAQVEDALLLLFDEFRLDTSKLADKVYNKLKNLIGENRLDIREMRQTRVQKRVYFNCIFASNDRDLVRIPPDDRRFNVAPRQEIPLNTVVPIPMLLQSIAEEFQLFVAGMSAMQIDTTLLNVVLHNDARAELQALSETTVDEFVRAVNNGDIDYFLEVMDVDHGANHTMQLAAARAVIRRWLDSEIRVGYQHTVSVEDLRVLYSALVTPIDSVKKFGRMIAIHGIRAHRERQQGARIRGPKISWQLDEPRLADLKHRFVTSTLPDNVAKMNR